MSPLNNTKKRFKKKIKNAKSHGNNSYKKRKRKFRKNKTENKRKKRHFKNQTMKNKKKKKILFRVKKKIMKEIEDNIQKGGVVPKLHSAAAIWTTGSEFVSSTSRDDGSGSTSGDDGSGSTSQTSKTNKTNSGKRKELKKKLGIFKLLQYHK
jgi:hypothetical protein